MTPEEIAEARRLLERTDEPDPVELALSRALDALEEARRDWQHAIEEASAQACIRITRHEAEIALLESQLSEVREERDGFERENDELITKAFEKNPPMELVRIYAQKLESEAAALRKENNKLRAAIEWAEGAYWWRIELSQRAALASTKPSETPTRCPHVAKWYRLRCGKPAGHEGIHEPSDNWRDESTPEFLAMCDLTAKPAETPEHTNQGCRVLTQKVSDAYCLNCRRKNVPAKPSETPEKTWPCAEPGCTVMRTKAQGGNVFTVCDEHWKKKYPEPAKPAETEECGLCGGRTEIPTGNSRDDQETGYQEEMRPCPACAKPSETGPKP